MTWRHIITIETGKPGGKPCIRGLRVTVYDILSDLAAGMSEDQILADLPYLTRDDIRACLAYAAEREQGKIVAAE
jgi:uncharacterized protein (DUF433 family)